MNRYCTVFRAIAVFAVLCLVWAGPQPASAHDAEAEPSAGRRCGWLGSFECPIRLNAETYVMATFKEIQTSRQAIGNGYLFGRLDEKFFVFSATRGERLSVSASPASGTPGRADVFVYGPDGRDLGGGQTVREIEIAQDGDHVFRIRQSTSAGAAWKGKFSILATTTQPRQNLPQSQRCAADAQTSHLYSVRLYALPGTTGFDFFRCLAVTNEDASVMLTTNQNIVYKLDRGPTRQRKDRFGTVQEVSVTYSILKSVNAGKTFARVRTDTFRSSLCREPKIMLIDPNTQITANRLSDAHIGLLTRCYDSPSDLRGHGVALSLSANGGRTFEKVASW